MEESLEETRMDKMDRTRKGERLFRLAGAAQRPLGLILFFTSITGFSLSVFDHVYSGYFSPRS